MKTLILNGNNSFEIREFSMTTSFEDNDKRRTIFIALEGTTNNNHDSIYSLGDVTITTIEIDVDNERVYFIDNIEANILYIHEDLADNEMRITMDVNVAI